MIEYQSKTQEDLPGTKPTIAVVGIGGAGANVLDRIALEGLTDAELISMNSDVRALANSVAPTKIQLGKALTQGLGAGGDPDLGRDAAQASIEEIRDALRGKDLVFLCSGQGGGIGSGAAPLIAQAAKEQGAFVVVFATMPFCFEGKRRLAQARQSLDSYGGVVDALITFDNDRMGELILPKEGIQQAFAAADQIISQSIRAVTALVTQPGLIHIGMDDLISALRNNDSRCLFGYGAAKGQNRAQEALKRALKSPLLDKGKLLEKSKNLLVHICGGESMTLYEVELLMNALEKHVPETTQILFGASSDKSLGDSLSVTLISSLASVEMSGEDVDQGAATGAVESPSQTQAQPQPQAQPAGVAAPAGAAVNLTSGDSIIRSEQPVAQQQPGQRPLAEVSAQVAQQSPEVVEPPLSPPVPAPPPVSQPQQLQPVSAAPAVQTSQPSQASGLGKPSEPVQAASAAVESAPKSAEIATVETKDATAEVPASEAVEETGSEEPSVSIGAVPAPDAIEEAESVGESEEVSEAATESGEGHDDQEKSAESAVVEVKVPAESDEEVEAESDEEVDAESDEDVEAESDEDVEAESEEEVEAESEEEVEAESEEEVEAESDEDVEAESDEDVEAESDEEVEAESDEDVEAEFESDEDVEAESDEDVEAESDEDVEAESDEDVEAESDEDVEAESDEEVEAESDEEVEAESDEEVEAESDEEVEAESDEDVEAESDEDVEAESDEGVKAESDEEVEAESDEEVESKGDDSSGKSEKPAKPQEAQPPVLVKAKGTAEKAVILKPVARQELSPAAKVESREDEPMERPVTPVVDMASALAEAEKDVEALSGRREIEPKPEPMGTMGPAAALGLQAASNPGGPSSESVGRPTVTAKDPRTGKQQMLELEPVAKGRFDKAEPTVVDGEDLDIPTFLRKKGNYT